MLTSILQQVYSLADGIIAGRFLGINAFSAITAAGFIAWLPQNMILGITHGFGVVLSRLFGAGLREEFKKANQRSCILTCISALFFSAVILILLEKLLVILNFPTELWKDASEYLVVIQAGLVFFALFNWAASALRAMGDSNTPFFAMIVSFAINLALDFAFIKVFGMGAIAPALSTVIGQIVSFLYCLTALMIRKYSFPMRANSRVDGSVKQLLYMSVPPMIRDGVIAVGGLAVQSVVNEFGIVVLGGMAAANRFFSMICMAGGCFEGVVSTYAGQNFGAGNYGRIRKGIRDTLVLSLLLAVFSIAVFWLLAPVMIRIIIGPDETEILSMGVYWLRCSLLFLPFLHALFIYRPAIQGMGSSITPMISGFSELGMRLFCVYLLTESIGYTSACIADGTGWLLASAVLLIRYIILIDKYDPAKLIKNRA